ncbi:MAG: transcription termination/antitermination protein NusG [Mycoplasmataceae bacterium]|nr:transcription termination/antitermination protein NusG [Mycoplasmataceae bacterium]
MSNVILEKPQWFIVSAISGKEKSIAENIAERIVTYGYTDLVKNIQIINRERTEVTNFSKNDSSLPKNLNNTKITTWKVLEDGNYQKISLKTGNKFPGYIFVNMVYNQDVWYVIRNTQGVLGFVGSSGKGAKPIPISELQYRNSFKNINNEKIDIEEYMSAVVEKIEADTIIVEQKYDFIVGDVIEIVSGKFANHAGKIIELNNDLKLAVVEISSNEGTTKFEVPYSDIKK